MADINSTLPVTDSADGTVGTSAGSTVVEVGVKNSSGNLAPLTTDINSDLPVADVVHSPGQNQVMSITTTAAQAMGGASVLSTRKFISIQPLNGTIYWGMTSGVTVANGMPLVQNQQATFSFSASCPLYLISASTVNVAVAEG